MLGLFKYLKPFSGLIIAAILLLFVQAMADLALPDYMANIVNKGIQQGGIVHAVPAAIRKSRMAGLTLFMTEGQKDRVLGSYDLLDRSSPYYGKYVRFYPGLADEPVFVLKTELDNAEIAALDPIVGKALITVSTIERMQAEAEGGPLEFAGQQIPAGADLLALFKNLPPEQRNKISAEINKRFTALGEGMIVQAAAGAVKAEYAALGMDTDKIQNRYILRTGLIMLVVSIISAVCIISVGFLGSRTGAGLARNLRRAIFAKVQGFSKAEMDRFSTATLLTRTTNDITQIQMLVVIMMRMVFFAPILGLGGIIRALHKSPSMSWVIALMLAALLALLSGVFFVALPKFRVVQRLIDRLNLVARENLSGLMVIRAFNTQQFEENRFDAANRDLTNTNLFISRVMVVMFPLMILFMNGVMLLILWVGAHQIAASSLQVGDMMAFMQYAMQIIFAFLMMSFVFIMVPRAQVAAQRLSEILNTAAAVTDPETPKIFKENLRGTVEFKNVSFRYAGAEKDMLKNISFKAFPGQTTAIIGSTGAGKTTLVNLIPRFYDVTGGQVLVGGVDVREVPQAALRDKIGYIPQQTSLFSGTIASNLQYACPDATEKEMEKAAAVAQATEFVQDKPAGFNAIIAQGGANVSGGQKQRLSIARALLKKPEIYIFDDSFSALDFKTDAALRRALPEETVAAAVIIVAQRISTIIGAEKIIVLDEGSIAGMGSHSELLKNCKTYREIALSQFSEEELPA